MTSSIENTLNARGIVTEPESTCPGVTAKVDKREDGIFVQVRDSYGRASERIVADAETASAIIESWARGDLTDPLMMSLLPVPPEPAEAVEDGPPAPEVAPVAATMVFQPWSLMLGLDGEAGIGFDGSTWFGGSLSGCGRVGPFCIGATARAAFDTMLSGDSKILTTNRMGVDVLVTVDFPMKWGIVSIVPGVGVGVGWFRVGKDVETPDVENGVKVGSHDFNARYDDEDEDEDDDDEDDDDNDNDEDDDDDDDDNNDNDDNDDDNNDDDLENAKSRRKIDDIGMRLNAHLLVGFELSQRFVLVIGVSADFLVLVHTDSFIVDNTEIAGVPRGFVRGVLGLRFGLP